MSDKTDTVLCIASAAINQYRFVQVDGTSGKLEQTITAGDEVFGVATEAASADGDEVAVAIGGYTLVDFGAGGALFGKQLTTDTNGKAVVATATDVIIGYAAPEPVNGAVSTIAANTRGRIYIYGAKGTVAS